LQRDDVLGFPEIAGYIGGEYGLEGVTATATRVPSLSMKRMPEMTDAEEIVWLLGEAFRRSRQLVDQVVRDAGITATQLGILKRIEHTPGISRVELARQNFISPQAAQVHLTTLESKGLVARRARSRGKRSVGTHLTAKGRPAGSRQGRCWRSSWSGSYPRSAAS
jgi:hypothetical protein